MAIQIIDTKTYFAEKKTSFETFEHVDQAVLDIIQNVQKSGDQALLAYTKQFDDLDLEAMNLEVSEAEFDLAFQQVDDAFIQALQQAKNNITEFHQAQKEKSWFYQRKNGAVLGQQIKAMASVGIYVPGGKAAYPSTVLMNAIPAKIAGVEDIFMTTPAQKNGAVNPHVLVAAHMAGVDRIFKLGGAQAIAALAYGSETIPSVDKIVGPGNIYVARAKKWVYGDVGIDMIAGPSEICVVADASAKIDDVAADLLSQAEHDENAQAVAIVFSESAASQLQTAVARQLKSLARQAIAEVSIRENGQIIMVEDIEEAIRVVNDLAPEHLELILENASAVIPQIEHAGAIFSGPYAPEPLGDYMAGPNHTLPTSGTARFASPLGVYDFMKKSSIIQYSQQAFAEEAQAIETIANQEGLHGHAASIRRRREAIENNMSKGDQSND